MTSASLRIVVADDQALVRHGFAGIIAATPGLAVAAEAPDGAVAVAEARRTRPHVVLMDIRMPVLDGIEATRQITASCPGTRVLILTTFDLDDYVYAALRAGASGFLLKDAEPEELLHAIRVVAAGEALLAPRVTRRLITQFARTPLSQVPVPDPLRVQARHQPHPGTGATRPGTAGPCTGEALADLTEREREVLSLIAEGRSNQEIAADLYISPATVKTHVAHLLGKLDARDRVQLVILAFRSGLAALAELS